MIDLADLHKITGGRNRVGHDWVSPSKLRPLNHGIDDPCLAWLSLNHGEKYGLVADEGPHTLFAHICKMGSDFENAFMDHELPNTPRGIEHDHEAATIQGLLKTIELLEGDASCLSHVALWHPGGIFGSADLVVKASWFHDRYKNVRQPVDEPDHWLPIEIKASRRLESAAKKHDLEIYKNQLQCYASALHALTGRAVPRAYIISPDHIDSPLEVELNPKLKRYELDPNVERMRRTYLDIKQHGASLVPWKHELVRANWANFRDEPWGTAKKVIAKKHMPGLPLEFIPHGSQAAGELRRLGWNHFGDLLKNPPARSVLRSIKGIGPSTAAQIEAVIMANQVDAKITIPSWGVEPIKGVEAYCDYEFVNQAMLVDYHGDYAKLCEGDLPHNDIIFMAGLGWVDSDGTYQYQQFVAPTLDLQGEREVLSQLVGQCEGIGLFDNDACIWSWSPVEKSQSEKGSKRHGLTKLAKLPWRDLREAFISIPTTLKGCFGWGLKEIAAAVGGVQYDDGLNSGGSAMIQGIHMYQGKYAATSESEEYESLSHYLSCDVQSLHRIRTWCLDPSNQQRDGDASAERHGWYSAPAPLLHNKYIGKPRGSGWYERSKQELDGDRNNRRRNQRSAETEDLQMISSDVRGDPILI